MRHKLHTSHFLETENRNLLVFRGLYLTSIHIYMSKFSIQITLETRKK